MTKRRMNWVINTYLVIEADDEGGDDDTGDETLPTWSPLLFSARMEEL